MFNCFIVSHSLKSLYWDSSEKTVRLINVTQLYLSLRNNWGIASKLLIWYWDTSESLYCSPLLRLRKKRQSKTNLRTQTMITERHCWELPKEKLRDNFENCQSTQFVLTLSSNCLYFSGVKLEKDEKLHFGLDCCSFLSRRYRWYINEVSITILVCYGMLLYHFWSLESVWLFHRWQHHLMVKEDRDMISVFNVVGVTYYWHNVTSNVNN